MALREATPSELIGFHPFQDRFHSAQQGPESCAQVEINEFPELTVNVQSHIRLYELMEVGHWDVQNTRKKA